MQFLPVSLHSSIYNFSLHLSLPPSYVLSSSSFFLSSVFISSFPLKVESLKEKIACTSAHRTASRAKRPIVPRQIYGSRSRLKMFVTSNIVRVIQYSDSLYGGISGMSRAGYDLSCYQHRA